MFDADHPILKSDQDKLGRAVFSKYLARCILDHTLPDSLVIGLYGGWGSGKTSIIHLTLEELRLASSNMFDNEKPIILNFNPWSYSGQNELIYSFFRRLSAEMRRADYFEQSDKIIHLLECYISFFTHKPVPKALRPKRLWLSAWLRQNQAALDTWGWESGRDLTLVKAELNEYLRAQKHKLIIFIDNVARLQDSEINQIFQIVKSIGDFANTVYVLALDKHYVISAMDTLHHNEGADYLEKLVQLPFYIPAIAKQDLEIILLDRLQSLLTLVPEGSWDSDYWADVYYSSLKYFFDNCRDITRYVNTLSFSYLHVKDVVNPVDFFAISAIEIFEPNVFYGIRDNKDLLVDLAEMVMVFDSNKLAEDRLRCDEIIQRAEIIPANVIRELLIRLFPHLRRLYQPNIPFYHSEALARKNKRICTYDLFEVYFRLTFSKGYLSDNEMQAILSLTKDEEGFALALLRLNQDDRIPKFLDRLDTKEMDSIPTKDIPSVICALIDSADLFPPGDITPLHFGTSMRVHRIIHQLLARLNNSEERFLVFYDAIKKSNKSIYSIVHELMEQEKNYNKNDDVMLVEHEQDFTADELRQLKQAAVEKIILWGDNGRLAEHPQLIPLLYAWKMWGSDAHCERFIEHMIQNDRGLIAFLLAALKDPILDAMKKEVINPAWRNDMKNITDFISLEKITPRAVELFEDDYFDKLRETEQLALMIFLDYAKPKTRKTIPKTTV